MPTVHLGEFRRRDATDAAVRPDLVVVTPRAGDGRADLLLRLEPVLIEALIEELAVKLWM